MSMRTHGIRLLLGSLAVAWAASAPSMAQAAWWNQAYGKRIPVTITNPAGTALPTSNMSAEVSVGFGSTVRADKQDVRVLYTPNNGTNWTELDRQVYREPPLPGAWIVENASAGTTGYNTLPAGSAVTATNVSGDDGGATLTLPFNFPFGATTTNKVFMSIDGYLVPGTAQPFSQYGRGVATQAGIFPFTSDYTTLIPNTGMYFATDNNGPGGTARAIFRWEVAESGKTAVIAKFAAILYANGDIRFVYSDTVQPTSADVGGPTKYGEMSYGVEFNAASNGIIHFPTDNYPASADFSNHADILYTASGVTPSADSTRIVFRLVSPLAQGATSTGEYFIYYGNPSPTTAPSDVHNVYDFVLDPGDLPVGSVDTRWTIPVIGTATVSAKIENAFGAKGIILRNSNDHPRYIVSEGAMPKFKDAEMLARFVSPGDQGEIAPMMRVVQSPSNTYADPNVAYTGGVGYVTDGFGSQQGLASFINPTVNNGPKDFGGLVPDLNPVGIGENVLMRYQGQIINAKKWADTIAEPLWIKSNIDRAPLTLTHGTTTDPVYDQPGGVGFSSYYTSGIIVRYVAIRELGTGSTTGAADVLTPTATFVQGTVASSNAAYNPLTTATIHVTGTGTDVTVLAGPNGEFRVAVPAGSYTVTASEKYHQNATATVTASASDQTSLVLTYVGSTVTGTIRDGLFNTVKAGAKVSLLDSEHNFLSFVTADSAGKYTLRAPSGGSYTIGVEATDGTGAMQDVNLVSAATTTLNFSTRLVSNAGVEIPNIYNDGPDQWSNAFDTPRAYVYTRDQNHTPGGKWSIAILDPSTPDQSNHLSAWNPPPAAGGTLPVMTSLFDVRVSVWVYFTKTGQKARLRLRNNWSPSSVDVVAGQAPPANNDNQGGLVGGVVPVGQWYEIASKAPAGTVLANDALQLNLYAVNAAGGGNDGIVYFDDLAITQTPVAQAYGQVKDDAGNPVPNAFIGPMTAAAGLTPEVLLDKPVIPTDENGNYHLYLAATGTQNLGAWSYPAPDATTGALPIYGYITDVKSVEAVANPTSPVNFTLKRAVNVAKGAIFTAKDSAGNNRDTDTNLKPANATDDNLFTRWASSQPTGSTPVVTMNYDLGAAKSIDQVEVYWEAAYPGLSADTNPSMDVFIGNSTTATSNTEVFQTPEPNAHGLTVDYSGFAEGPLHIIKVDPPVTGRYIQIVASAYNPPTGNYSIIETRALSAAAPLIIPLTRVDAIRALQIAGGLGAAASSAEKTKYDLNGVNGVDLADAVAILKQAK